MSIKELDEVKIPPALAAAERVEECGTVVWCQPGATFATIECRIIDSNPDGLDTKLLDVAVDAVRPS